MIADSDGTLYGSYYYNGEVYKFLSDGTKSTFASGIPGVTGLAFNPVDGQLYFASQAGKSSGNAQMGRINSDGTVTASVTGFFELAHSIIFDGQGRAYVTERDGTARFAKGIYRFAYDGTSWTNDKFLAFPETGTLGYPSPTGMAWGPDGALYTVSWWGELGKFVDDGSDNWSYTSVANLFVSGQYQRFRDLQYVPAAGESMPVPPGAPVPEPSSALALFTFCAGGFGLLRKRLQSK